MSFALQSCESHVSPMRLIITSFGLLLYAGAAVRGLDDRREDKEHGKGGFGLLERAFKEAKRVGAAIDPDAAAQAEQTWNGFHPEIRQAADGILQAQQEFQSLGDEAGGIWSDVRKAASQADADAAQAERGTQGDASTFGWKGLKKDAAKMVKGVFGEVLGDATNDILATFETRLSRALSEGNIRAASQLWRRLLDTPGMKILAKEPRLWAGAERVVRQHLQGYMSEESAKEAERAVNATADYALHFAGLSRNTMKTDAEIFEELSHEMCHLQVAAEKLWPLASRALPILGYEEYTSKIEKAIKANAISRITLTVSASALLGLNPRNDPFLMTLIASYSLGHLTKDVAQNMASFFQKAFMDSTSIEVPRAPREDHGEAEGVLVSPLDLANDLMIKNNTCMDLGRQAFTFFQAVQRALAEPPSRGSEILGMGVHNTAAQDVAPRFQELPHAHYGSQDLPLRPARKLEMDGLAMQLAIWTAAVIDKAGVSPELLLAGVGVGFLSFFAVVCGLLLTWVKRTWSAKSEGIPKMKSKKQKAI